MATRSTFYLDGLNLSSSKSVYSDEQLTTLASDGWYSDGSIARQQVSGLLQAVEQCLECSTPCDGSISASGGTGVYLLSLDTGNTPSDLGAVIVSFNPASVPDGIRATFGGVTYNKLSSPVDGYHGSTNANNYTVVGIDTSDCGIAGSTYTLDEYQYSGGSFVATGSQQTLTLSSGDVSLTSGSAPGDCIMVIPKTDNTSTIIDFELVGPCSGTAFSISASCPTLLTGFQSSPTAAGTENDACSESLTTTYYNAPVNGTPGNIAWNDWVFSDPNGENVLPQGYYKYSGGWYRVDENGIISDLGTCSTLLTGFQSSSTAVGTENDACSESLTTTYYNDPVNGTPGNIGLFDWVYSDPNGQNIIPQGYYKDSQGWYLVDENGVVTNLGSCPNTFGTTLAGSIYVTTQDAFSLFLTNPFFSMTPNPYSEPDATWDGSKYTPPADLSFSGSSISQFISFTVSGTSSHTGVFCNLTLNDGTTDYVGGTSTDGSNNIVVTFNVGTSTGRNINLVGGELNIQF